ncbi:hypothetical protein SAMN05421835_12362 [Amycolatopsis sacchari]|uniref:Subtilisin inhibitor-like n=1 Tax=Amycolatopsis sacchari TaxID=115433 RepID=A0A1I4A804_9PSEU|nr:hypothetical protein [Amycolatopsis sacchari]SFK52515.1 hypothetical protein SAMN05421835_12362 [Amycolatopsis sacchari]
MTNTRTTGQSVALAALLTVAAVAVTGCHDPGSPGHSTPARTASAGAVVTGSAYSGQRGQGTHYAECTTPSGDRYRVAVSAATARQLRDGQPCPAGQHLPLPSDEHPELSQEMQKRLPYGGGDLDSPCGEWQTADRAEARRFAAQCPPLKWGTL